MDFIRFIMLDKISIQYIQAKDLFHLIDSQITYHQTIQPYQQQKE